MNNLAPIFRRAFADTDDLESALEVLFSTMRGLGWRVDEPGSAEQLLADRIMATVAEHFGLTVEQLRSRSRVRAISHPRAVAFWLLRRYVPGISFPEIGRKLGGFDHSSVMYGHRLVQECTRLREEADSIATKIVAVYAREHGATP